MFNWRARWGDVQRMREAVRLITSGEETRGRSVDLCCPRGGWYAEHAGEMVAVLDDAVVRLEAATELVFPMRVSCIVTDQETAVALQGAAGMAYRTLTVIGFRERCLSDFGQIATHELAHLLSRGLGSYNVPLQAEGFACVWAARSGAVRTAVGLPIHHHPAWMLSVGIKFSLEQTWRRRDYSPELYDLAWSFADFLVTRYGARVYHDFYRSDARELQARIAATLGGSCASVEREWKEHIRSRVDIDPRRLSRTNRAAGACCSRAAWLGRS